MKFHLLALATLAVGQVSVIDDAIKAIAARTVDLSNEFSAINSSTTLLQAASVSGALLNASVTLLQTVQNSTRDVARIDLLSDNDALGLAIPITELNKEVGSSIDTIIAKRDDFVRVSLASVVYGQLVSLRGASANFSAVTISKISHGLQHIADQISAPVIANLDRGVDAYAETVPEASRTSFAPVVPSATGAAVANVAGVGAIAAAAVAAAVAVL